MEFNLTNYAYELNVLIEDSFTFMYKFANMYETYGIEDYSKKNVKNLQTRVDKTYLDIAYIIYLQNFKAFNYSVGNKGICDLLPIVETNNKFNLVNDLDSVRKFKLFFSKSYITSAFP